MADESAFQQRARQLHKQHDELEAGQRAHFGEEEFQRRRAAKAATLEALYERVNPMVEEARKRGFVFFECSLDISSRTMPIRLQFADGNGAYYEKSLGWSKAASSNGFSPSLGDATDINAAVRIYVRGLEGIKMLSSGMQRRRVRAKADA